MASTAPVNALPKRACDSCHRRKIKCVDGDASTCRSCATAGLACTRNSIPQKKGPRGHRAKVLTELRNQQRNASLGFEALQELGGDGSSISHHVPDLLKPALLGQCIDFFFANMYPVRPVLERRYVDEAIRTMSWSAEARCTVLALCAYAMIHAGTEPLSSSSELSELRRTGCLLLEESCRLWRDQNYYLNPTYEGVLASWFHHQYYLELGNPNAAWCQLREATTLAQLLEMHNEETYQLRTHDAAQRRVLFWSLFIAERTHSIQFHRPVTLHATISLPAPNEVEPGQLTIAGLACLVRLYTSIDGTFVDLWNNIQHHADPLWLHKTQSDLLRVVPGYVACTESQAVEIQVTQYWLRVVFRQLCTSRGLMSRLSEDVISRLCPIRIVEDLEVALGGFSQAALDTYGDDMARQLFDIACCSINAAACQRFPQHASSPGIDKCVFRLLALIQSLRGGDSRRLSLLRAKLQEALSGALVLWPSGPTQGLLIPPSGFESVHDVRWTELGGNIPILSMPVTPTSMQIDCHERF